MKRRELVLCVLPIGVPAIARAQSASKVWRVGFLAVRHEAALQAAFARGMRERGYIEGRNLLIEARSAESRAERPAGPAEELVRLGVDAIVTAGTIATAAAQRATSTIPIVMGASADPVANGLVKSQAHPGDNTTGMSTLRTDTSPKLLELLELLELLRSAVPGLSRVAVMANPANSSLSLSATNLRSASTQLCMTIQAVDVRTRGNRTGVLDHERRQSRCVDRDA